MPFRCMKAVSVFLGVFTVLGLVTREVHASEPAAPMANAFALLSTVQVAPTRWNAKEPLYLGDLAIGGRGRAPLLYELDRSSEAVWRAVAARPLRGGGMLSFELHWRGTRTAATAGK